MPADLYADPAARSLIEAHVTATSARMLLTDISQSLGIEVAGLHTDAGTRSELAEVELTEVVRNSQRIVAGAASFQLGDRVQDKVRAPRPSDAQPDAAPPAALF